MSLEIANELLQVAKIKGIGIRVDESYSSPKSAEFLLRFVRTRAGLAFRYVGIFLPQAAVYEAGSPNFKPLCTGLNS